MLKQIPKNDMSGKNLNILLSLLILISLSGCAAALKKQNDYEIRVSENRVSFLETQIMSKDSQIANLTNALEKERQDKQDLLKTINNQEQKIRNLTQALQKKKKTEEIFPKSKSKTYYSFVIRIQVALKNAGFNPGLIDGKMGSRTRAALKKFQKTSGLSVDGRVDKQTWTLLRKHL